ANDEEREPKSDIPPPPAPAATETRSLLLSALRAPTNPVLLSDLGPVMPVVGYSAPTRSQSHPAALPSDIAAEPDKKKTKQHKATAARSNDDQPAPEKPANKKSVVAKPTDAKPTLKPVDTKPTDAKPAAKPSDTKTAAQASAAAAAPKKQAKPKPVAAPP